MRNKHITRFGNPTTTSGALYFVTDQEGILQMVADMEFARLYQEGVVITPLIKSLVLDRARRDQMIYHSKVNQKGVLESLKTLFKIDKKSEVEKYCKKLSLSETELFLLIHNCDQINFKHEPKFPEYVPSHLTITEDDRSNVKHGSFKPFTKKMIPLLSERRRIHVHLFQHERNWHCFYFSYDDIDPDDKNHWKYGCHLHYISYLWPNHTKVNIWKKFDKRATEIGGNIHIRFSPFEYTQSGKLNKTDMLNQNKKPPWIFDFDSDFVFGFNSEPSPTLQTATRGFWTATISARPKSND